MLDEYSIVRRFECEEDGLYFQRFFFKTRFGSKFIVSPHHNIINDTLDRVLKGEIQRLIINIPPGYGKTDQSVIGFMARGLALAGGRARFLHLSYADTLALLNSNTVRDIVKSSPFQAMWPMSINPDVDSKEIWHTDQGGGLKATSTGGQVTGFRAGHMDHAPNNFTGALIIDDPVKPDDAFSETVREKPNQNYSNTIKSRLAVESVPIIVVMQRIHENDLSGFLLKGGSGENWHHLMLPVEIKEGDDYPKEWTHGIPIEHGLKPGWLWPLKHNESHRVALDASRFTRLAQYGQRPPKLGAEGSLWKERTIELAREMPDSPMGEVRRVVAIDPAVSNDETSDDWGIVIASQHTDGTGKVLGDRTVNTDVDSAMDDAIKAFEEFDADAMVVEVNQGGDLIESMLRQKKFKGRIIKVRASKGKFARAEPVAALYSQGLISHAKFGLVDLEAEMLEWVPFLTKRSPNRIDALVWAFTELFKIGQRRRAGVI